jgi:hypothetical protein
MGQHRLQLLVNALAVEPLNQFRHWQLEDLTDAEQSGHSDGATGLHLLPVASGEAKGQHVLLRESMLLAKRTDSRPQSVEEFVLIGHTLRCNDSRAETPRAEWRVIGGKMKCIKCGADIASTAKFCLECGAEVASHPVESVERPVPSEEPSNLSEATRLSSDTGGRHNPQPRSLASNHLFGPAVVVAVVAILLVGAWLWITKHPISAKAQYELGQKFENGDGVAPDYLQAAYWYRKAAEQGDTHAQERLNQNDTMQSSCNMHLIDAEIRLLPHNEQALNARLEDVHEYITPEIYAYAMKHAWNDYQAESRLSHDKVCLAEWISFVQGTQPSLLKNAGVPILPDESRSRINDAMKMCAAGLGTESGCKSLKTDSVREHRIEANFLAIEMITEPSDSPGKFTFKLTNRSQSTSLFNIYFSLIMKDKEHDFVQKRLELNIPELRPVSSVTATMVVVPGWVEQSVSSIK